MVKPTPLQAKELSAVLSGSGYTVTEITQLENMDIDVQVVELGTGDRNRITIRK